jgi:HPt (histidine-containing phosphotransfer) domain-containing protein
MSAKQSTDLSPIDLLALKRLQKMFGSRSAVLLPEFIGSFLQDAVRLQTEACQAVSNGCAGDLRLAMHTLKSNSAQFGALQLAALCAQLEADAHQGQLERAENLLAQIAVAFEDARQVLQALRFEDI